ncbi:MAG: IclR family transcriptional regulator [Sphingomonadales bacterium]|nr:IclR family transcriptional regulator [Sphingomonadales bacterium]
MSDSVAVNAVVTSFVIIEYMADHGRDIGVSDVARALNTGRPLIYRHLRTLVELGYAAQDPVTEKYALTSRLFHLGQAVADQIDFLAAARRVMPELSQAVKLAVSVGQIEARGVRILDLLRYRSSIEITTPPGTLFDFTTSAQGKVALAFSPGLWDRQFGAKARKNAELEPADIATLKDEIDAIHQQGWAASLQEVLVGVNALAAPLFDGRGMLAGTIAIVGSAQTLPAPPEAATVQALVSAARQISEQLGYRKGDDKP